MTRIYCDSPIHKVSSLALAFIILAFCVLPSFVMADSVRPNEPIGYKDGDTFRDILLVVLDSWGISFSKSDSQDDTSLLEYSDQLMQEFYEDIQTTQELFWDLVKYGVDQTGNIILDFLGVNKIREFANWLKNKFSLSNNTTVPVYFSDYDPSPSLTQFLIPLIVSDSASSVYANGRVAYYQNGIYVNVASADDAYMLYVSANGLTADYSIYFTLDRYAPRVYYSNGSSVWYHGSDADGHHGPFNTRQRSWTSGFYLNTSDFHTSYPVFSSLTAAYEFLDSFAPDITISTDTLTIPEDTDLDPDDGLQIVIPGTNWGDSIYSILDLIERLIGLYDNTQLEIISIVDTLENLIANLQHSVYVENIPGAVTLDYDDYDIPLENEWGLFDIFFNSGGDEITLLRPWQELKSIIYGFPAPVLSFFALVVLFIVAYGFIRMGRDSH